MLLHRPSTSLEQHDTRTQACLPQKDVGVAMMDSHGPDSMWLPSLASPLNKLSDAMGSELLSMSATFSRVSPTSSVSVNLIQGQMRRIVVFKEKKEVKKTAKTGK